MKKNEMRMVTVRVPVADREQLMTMAKEIGTHGSTIVRQLIHAYVGGGIILTTKVKQNAPIEGTAKPANPKE